MHTDDSPTTADLDISWSDTLERLRSFVAARVGDYELAADITQDVIVRSIANGALDHVDNPTAWLYRSARNAVIDHYRTRRTHDSIVDLDAWPAPDDDRGPNEASRELSNCLRPMLAQLRPAAREALERVDVGGQTQSEAALEMGLTVSGMKSRVQRARNDLKQILEQCCSVELDSVGAVADYRHNAGGCGCQASSVATPCTG